MRRYGAATEAVRRRPLRVLFVEDSPADVKLCLRELKKACFDVTEDVVQTREEFLERIRAIPYDIILSDQRLPKWNGTEALECVQQEGKDIPFILVTGTLGDEAAVECIKKGATDYVLKDRLARLPVAIRQALEEKTAREQETRLEEELRESEERYTLAAQGANDGVWDWNLKSNQIYFSPRWKSMLGFELNEIGNSPEEWFTRVHPKDIGHLKTKITAHLGGHVHHLKDEYRMLHKDGTYRWMFGRGLAVRNPEGRASRVAGSQTDITERKASEERLLHDAFHDALTGLPNRALFMDRLGLSLGRAKRPGASLFAVLFLDLDRFKVVNDSLGHAIGDELLVAMAQRLKRCLRPGDTVARFGGDEFAFLLVDVKKISGAIRVAERIKEALAAPFNLDGHEVFATASIGLTMGQTDYAKPEDFLRDADAAMYRAKAQGRARYEIFDSDMHARAVTLLHLESDLRGAIDHHQLSIHYQPIISLQTGSITGAEALLRWQHPQRGFVSPGEFIPLAEETGLIRPIGEWVLWAACAQATAWQADGYSGLRVTVNFSSRQFEYENIQELIQKVLKETRLAPQTLELEITESMAIRDCELGARTLNELRAIQIRISIDDFGIGSSSLAYLKRLPIATLKIDRSFVRDLATDPDDASITSAIIAMAHSLKLNVVAEGVETEEQLAFLRSQQCDEMQGYLFSPPVPPEAFSKLLREGHSLFRNREPYQTSRIEME
ncbi:MAG: EAL domain-containing protein [Candidatus Acidiferrales bacterium]